MPRARSARRDTLGDLADTPGPAILINATDLARGSRFAFVPEQFDPICSNLRSYHVARAVAASSAVPGLLTPIMVRSYEEVDEMAKSERVSLREAALLLAVRRVAEAIHVRGVYP